MEISSKNGIYPIVRVKKFVIVRNSYDFTLKSKVIEPINLLGMLDWNHTISICAIWGSDQ